MESCYKCQCDVSVEDNFCRECGAPGPGQYVGWDWKASPSFTALNLLLQPYGCKIEELETNSDQCAARVVPLKKR